MIFKNIHLIVMKWVGSFLLKTNTSQMEFNPSKFNPFFKENKISCDFTTPEDSFRTSSTISSVVCSKLA